MSIKITIGQQNLSAETTQITKTIDSLCDTFSMEVLYFDFATLINQQIQISLSDTLLLTGYIDRVTESNPSNNHMLSINGRSRSSDIIDSRITYSAHGKTLAQLSKELFAKFNQDFTCAFGTETIPQFNITAESAFEALAQLAKQQNLIYVENPDGSVKLEKPNAFDKKHIILNSQNLSNFQINTDLTKDFHKITVKPSSGVGNLTGATDEQTHSDVANTSIRSTRIFEEISDKHNTTDACQKRTEQNKNQAVEQKYTASGTHQAWIDPTGASIWQTNSVYTVKDTQMVLASINFNQSGANRTSQLNFKGVSK